VADIIDLFIALPDQKGRRRCDELTLDEEGVQGDKFYGKNRERSVLITTRAAYVLAQKHGIALEAGDLGENILLDLDPAKLKEGSRITIGEVELEVSRRCPICEHLAIYDERLPRLVKEIRGVYLSVRRGGRIDRSSPMEIVCNRGTEE